MTNGRRLRPVAGYAGLGVILYLLFLLATAPATWFTQGAARLSNGAVTLTQPSGTLWRGAADLQAGSPATSTRHLGRLHWSINPWWLFVGRAQFSVQLQGATTRGQADVRLARNQIEVRRLSAVLPANLASVVYGPAAFFEPRGTIALKSPNIELSGAGLMTKLELQWDGAGGRFTGPAALGDYRVEVNGTGENAAIRVTTLRGDLDIAGQGQWRVTGDGALTFTGSAAPRGGAASQLEPLLRGMGRDLGNGRREIRFSGRFPLVEQLGL